jgi:hypothetical protein
MSEERKVESVALRTPPTSGSTGASAAHRLSARLESVAERGGDAVWRRLKHRPYLGVVLFGAAGLALASTVGAAEIAMGLVAGYAAYLVLKKNEPPSQAMRDARELGREIGI